MRSGVREGVQAKNRWFRLLLMCVLHTNSARCRYRGQGTHTSHSNKKRMMARSNRKGRGSTCNYIGWDGIASAPSHSLMPQAQAPLPLSDRYKRRALVLFFFSSSSFLHSLLTTTTTSSSQSQSRTHHSTLTFSTLTESFNPTCAELLNALPG